jgi:hypothetical protein
MNVSVEGAYIEDAHKIRLNGEFVSFEDDDGLKVYITPEVIAKLYMIAFPGEFS